MAKYICLQTTQLAGSPRVYYKGEVNDFVSDPGTRFALFTGERLGTKRPTTKMDQDDGTYYYGATGWDDLRFPLEGARLDSASGRLEYDFTECEVVFGDTARYPEEPVCVVAQMQHAKQFGSPVAPHLHWIQDAETVPNWLIAYRFYNNGAAPGAFTLAAYTGHAFTYVSGDLLQISLFPLIPAPANENVSSILDVKIFNDSANTSTLFDGAVALAGRSKEFDLHYKIDSLGSGQEYEK